MSPRLKRGLHIAGSGLAVIGGVFVAMRLGAYADEIDLAAIGGPTWSAAALLAMVYGASNVMLALAWRNLLGHFGVAVPVRWAVWAYGVSQIAKYVPGNIVHLAGRQALCASAGLPNWPVAKSAVWELGMIAGAGGVFGLLALPGLFGQVSIGAGIMLFCAALVVVLAVLWKTSDAFLVRSWLWYVGFLALSGGGFYALLELMAQPDNIVGEYWVLAVGSYVLAWLAGLVTPGAPAGLGVREMILLLLLQGLFGAPVLALVVVLGRIVTAAGDALFFCAVLIYRNAALTS